MTSASSTFDRTTYRQRLDPQAAQEAPAAASQDGNARAVDTLLRAGAPAHA